MTDIRTTALRTVRNNTLRKLASEVGFCIDDRLADAIAESVVYKITNHATECESRINHLYRGREAFSLSERDKRELTRLASQFEYIAKTAREVLAAQEPVSLMEAAE